MMVPFDFMVVNQKNIQRQVGFWVLVINITGSYRIAHCIRKLVKPKSNQDFLGQEKLVKAPEGTVKKEKY